ncbi:MAG: hypothetical protein SHS37scaffold296_17 [Burkholderiales phage 68_11]|nr:MAG: hypothetical protein SHS37scaffold296_17 [Burkholderiales phage 68_11]
MDWKDIAAAVGKSAPILGTLLAGPAGGAIGGLVASVLGTGATPSEVSQALATNPDAAVKLREIEASQQIRFQELATDEAKAQILAAQQAVTDTNATMRAEAAAEHWPTYSWRPAIGFAVALDVLLSSLLVCGVFTAQVFNAPGAAAAVAALPATLGALAAIVGLALPVLGIASYFRGRMQADPAIPSTNRG